MRKRSLPPTYSIEDSPDGEPQIVRYLLARMVRAKLLKLPPLSSLDNLTEEQRAASWVSSLSDGEKGVTPETVQEVKYQWTAEGKDKPCRDIVF